MKSYFAKDKYLFSVTGTFACTLKFLVKDCDPQTGEPDDEGYEDEYVVSADLVNYQRHILFFYEIISLIEAMLFID